METNSCTSNWAVHEREDESDEEDPSVESTESPDDLLSPLTSDSEDIDLEIEINESINEENFNIIDDR